MGGPVPLGYEVKERKLVANEAEAELVRHIYRRYIALRSVKELVEELAKDGHVTKIQHRASGPHRGGVPFQRGTLYHLLSNRIYLGEIVHKGEAHAGEHLAIVPAPLWTEVQDKLAARGPGTLGQRRSERCSHLIGLLFDGLGRPMTSTHTTKGPRRYRYYRTREATDAELAWSAGAHDIEHLVQQKLGDLLIDHDQMARLIAGHDPRQVDHGVTTARKLATGEPLLPSLALLGVHRIDLKEDHLEITIRERDLLRACGMIIAPDHDGVVCLSTPVKKVRRGHDIRLVIPGKKAAGPPAARPDPTLISLVHEAMETRKHLLAQPDQNISAFAASRGKCRKRATRLLHLSWLAPDIVKAIVEGTQPASLTSRVLMTVDLPVEWDKQKADLGFG
ncbi:MAG: recombinase family protein [Sphingobium sp.]